VVPHFAHWLPLVAADCALVIRKGTRPRLVWPTAQDFWEHAPPPADGAWAEELEIDRVSTAADVRRALPPLSPHVAFVGEDARRAGEWGHALLGPGAVRTALDRLRVQKSDYEVACIAEANRRAAVGHAKVRDAFRAGDASELELHLLYLAATAQDDPETPYKNIVALGSHAATLHHVSYDRRPRGGDSLLLDAGVTFRGYASDITRTYVKGGGAARATFAELVARIERMQQRLCGEAQVGLRYEVLHQRAHDEVGRILADLGVVRVGAEEAVQTGLTRAFFPHGLGHSLGLQVHDVGCAEVKPRPENPFLRNTTVIAEGQVFTIEPGIYFIDLLLDPLRAGVDSARVDWSLVDALTPLGGVRVEDDLQVLGTGARNLTREALPQ
jgi:Xaa-Pro dipeptidase